MSPHWEQPVQSGGVEPAASDTRSDADSDTSTENSINVDTSEGNPA